MIIFDLAGFIFFCFVLVKSSALLVRSLTKVATFLKLNEFAIGFIIMAISTSLPELFVGVMSAIHKNSVLALGNVIGSNILDMTLVIGIVTLLSKGVKIESKIIKRDLVYMLGFLILPIFLMVDHNVWNIFGFDVVPGLSRIDGLILVGCFVWYMWILTKQERKFHKEIGHVKRTDAIRSIAIFIFALILLLVSSEFVVAFATNLSLGLDIAPILMGMFIIAIGTSLPELIFEAKAVLTRHEGMAIGDLIGSVIANSLLVLGVTAVIYPINASMIFFFSSAMFMILVAFIFLTFAESERGLSWKEGMSMLLLYIFFVMMETYIKTNG